MVCAMPVNVDATSISQEDAVVETKKVRGTVSIVRPWLLALEYKQDLARGIGYEMSFPLDAEIEVSGAKRSIGELEPGDTVSVTYEEKTWMTDEGDEGLERHARRATEIVFIKSAPSALKSANE